MRFLIDENLPESLVDLAKARGHDAEHVRPLGLRGEVDTTLAEYAIAKVLCILTTDGDFADVRQYPPEKYAGIVVAELPPTANLAYITRLFESLFNAPDVLALVPGRLAILEPGRVRLRPAD